MPETVNDKKVFSLQEVTTSIRKTLFERYTTVFWVKAEMNKLNHYPSSGHCYPDLVEKKDGKIIAQMRANLWRSDYEVINEKFKTTIHEPLKEGIKILFAARVAFHEVHGLGLQILDIDPSYSLGELEAEKQNTINRLHREGLFQKNKALKLPLLPKRVAIISVETSKGYHDFLKKIEPNPWGYKLFHMLFPSLLQGDNAVQDIVRQLNRIKKIASHFDLVAIIRGGGGDIGLTCYNHFELCKAICEFPLPVFTGIGHSTNETVTEMISYKNCITPTDLADSLLQLFHEFSLPLKEMELVLTGKSTQLLDQEKKRMENATRYFQSVTKNSILFYNNQVGKCMNDLFKDSKVFFIKLKPELDNMRLKMEACLKTSLRNRSTEMEHMNQRIQLLDPANVLKRGYTITKLNGRFLRSSNDVKENDILTTVTNDGEINSIVTTQKENL